MSTYIQLDFDADPSDLADIAISYLQDTWAGWMPNDGDPEVVVVEALAPLAANAAAVAAQMPLAAFINFGTQILGIPYDPGSSASTQVTFTVVDSSGYTIPAGTQIEIDTYGFALAGDLVIPPGQTTGVGTVVSTVYTAAANGLTGASSLSPMSTPAWVIGLTVSGGATSGGSDPQTDIDYANELSRDRQLTSRSLVTLLDYEYLALDQPLIGRAKAFTPSARNINVYVLGSDGNFCSSTTKNALLALYNAPNQRLVNVTNQVSDPTFTTVNVAYSVVSDPNVSATDLVARINAVIGTELSPLGWGVPSAGDPGSISTTWINQTTVYLNRMVQVIGKVTGVNYVNTLTLNGSAANLALSGTAPLPKLGTCSGSVSGTAT